MIAYFDASALVPLYARDRATRSAIELRRSARVIATSLLSYAEVLAALRQLRDRKGLTIAAHRLAASSFLAEWPTFQRISLRAPLLGEVRRLLEAHPLKGADAVQLASGLVPRVRTEGRAAESSRGPPERCLGRPRRVEIDRRRGRPAARPARAVRELGEWTRARADGSHSGSGPMIKIVRATHRGGYRIELEFSTGECALVDLAELVRRPGSMVIPLRDEGTFCRFFIELGALAWENGFELSAESLYRRAKEAGSLRRGRAA